MARRKEERDRERPAVPRRDPVPMDRSGSNGPATVVPPRIALAGSKPSWREREAAKAAGGGSDAAPERVLAERPAPERQIERPIERQAAPPRASVPFQRTESADRPPSGGPPRLALSGGKPSWRDREAAKGPGGSDSDTRSAPAPTPSNAESSQTTGGEAPKPAGGAGKWVPRHLRDK